MEDTDGRTSLQHLQDGALPACRHRLTLRQIADIDPHEIPEVEPEEILVLEHFVGWCGQTKDEAQSCQRVEGVVEEAFLCRLQLVRRPMCSADSSTSSLLLK